MELKGKVWAKDRVCESSGYWWPLKAWTWVRLLRKKGSDNKKSGPWTVLGRTPNLTVG